MKALALTLTDNGREKPPLLTQSGLTGIEWRHLV